MSPRFTEDDLSGFGRHNIDWQDKRRQRKRAQQEDTPAPEPEVEPAPEPEVEPAPARYDPPRRPGRRSK